MMLGTRPSRKKSGVGEPQVNVHEEDILDQRGSVVDAISVTEDIAEVIMVGLIETHRQVKAAP